MHPVLRDFLDENAAHAAAMSSAFDDLQTAQHPDAVTICCSDSRVLQDLMWGNDVPGRVFTCSNIGNRVVQQTATGRVVSGDVLYPVEHTGTDLVIIVGHTGCGAVTAAYEGLTGDHSEPTGIEHCLALLRPHLEAGVEALPADLDRTDAVNRLVEYNVDRQIEVLRESPEVPGDIDAVGVVYDFQDVYDGQRGEVHVVNVDGERSVDRLRDENPAIASRIDRLWEY